jgi:hypothetical protein
MMLSFIPLPRHTLVCDASPVGSAAAFALGVLRGLALSEFADGGGKQPFEQHVTPLQLPQYFPV